MALFTDADLQAFSDLAMDLGGKDTAQILRNMPVQDDQGGGSEDNWQPVGDPVQCMVVDGGNAPMEQAVAQQYIGRTLKKVFLPRNTDVKNTDRMVIAGITYEVAGTFDPTSFEALRRVMVVEGAGE